MTNRQDFPIEEETTYTGETNLGGWIVGWSGHEFTWKPQVPKIRVKPGPIEIKMTIEANVAPELRHVVTYIVASIAITEDGNTIHSVALNPKQKG